MEMYQDEHLKETKAEYEKINYTAWMNGQYIISAIQKALEPKKAKYPDKPYSKNEVDENGEGIDVYETFRRKMRAMNERIKDNE